MKEPNERGAAKSVPCHACHAPLENVLSFGPTPVADLVLTEAQLGGDDDHVFPMDLGFCPSCTLIQLMETVSPELLYKGDYPYYTATVPGLLAHFTDSARRLIRERCLGPDDLVLEVASNDGHTLKIFKDEAGCQVLGVDPAEGPARVAQEAGVPTLCEFFTLELVNRLVREGKRSSVVLGNNVLNLISDLNDFGKAVKALMTDDGVCVIEVPYSVQIVERTEFDMFFHQNVCYYSGLALDRLFRKHGLYINVLERLPTFGGSLRLFIEHRENVQPSVTQLLEGERAKGLDTKAYYEAFAERTEATRGRLREMVLELKKQGKRIVAYGAAGGMATTMLSYLGLGRDELDYAVDGNHHKHGRYTPGSHLRIYPPSKLVEDRPDYALLLAWNYKDEVLKSNAEYRQLGGKFIVPLPNPEIV